MIDSERVGAWQQHLGTGSQWIPGKKRPVGRSSNAFDRTSLAGSADLPGASLDAEVAYGLDAMRGLLTPYTGVALTESGETWRAGARWKLGPAFDLELEASLKESAAEEKPKSGLLLRGSRRW